MSVLDLIVFNYVYTFISIKKDTLNISLDLSKNLYAGLYKFKNLKKSEGDIIIKKIVRVFVKINILNC